MVVTGESEEMDGEGGNDGGSGGPPFSLLEDRMVVSSSLPSVAALPMRCLDWSPTMDLLAVVAADLPRTRYDQYTRGMESEQKKGNVASRDSDIPSTTTSSNNGVSVEVSCFRLDSWTRLWTTTMTDQQRQNNTRFTQQLASTATKGHVKGDFSLLHNEGDERLKNDHSQREERVDVCAAWAPHGKALAVAQSFTICSGKNNTCDSRTVSGLPSTLCNSSSCILSLVDVEAGAVFSNISIPHTVNVMIWTYNNSYDDKPNQDKDYELKNDPFRERVEEASGNRAKLGKSESVRQRMNLRRSEGYLVDDFAVTCAVERLQRSDRFTPNNNAGLNIAGNRYGSPVNDEKPKIVSEKTATSESEKSASIARNRMNAEIMMTMMMTPKSKIVHDTKTKMKRSVMGFDLLIAAGSGHVSLLSKGVFQIATLNLNKVINEHYRSTARDITIVQSNPISVNVNSSCSELAVMMEVTQSGHEQTKTVCVATFDTHFSSPVVLSNILTASTQSTIILSLSESAIATLNASKDRYQSSLDTFQKKLRSLHRMLNSTVEEEEEGLGQGYGIKNDTKSMGANVACAIAIKNEMHACLLHGAADAPALTQWLTIDLGEATLRRMARSIDNECTNMYNTIVKNMSDDCAEILFRIGELKSLALVHSAINSENENYNSPEFQYNYVSGLGYSVSLLSSIEEDAMLANLLLQLFSATITRKACTFRAYFSFLHNTIRTLNTETNSNSSKNPNPNKTFADASNNIYFDSDLVVEFIDQYLEEVLNGNGKIDKREDDRTTKTAALKLLQSIPQSHISALGLSAAMKRLQDNFESFNECENSSLSDILEKILNKQLNQFRDTVKLNLLKPEDNVVSPPLTLNRVFELESRQTKSCHSDLENIDELEDLRLHSVVAPCDENPDEYVVDGGFLLAFKSHRLNGDIVIINFGNNNDAINSEAFVARLAAPNSLFINSIRHYKENCLGVLMSEKPPALESRHVSHEENVDEIENCSYLALIDTAELVYKRWSNLGIHLKSADLKSNDTLFKILEGDTGNIIHGSQLRSCGKSSPCQPFLSVSGRRGVGCAVIGRRRILVYDMEANEDDDEDDDEEEDDDDEDDDDE